MFESLLGKKEQNSSLENKIYRMNLTEMRSYIKNNMTNIESSSDGLSLVMDKLITKNERTSKRYIQADDMDSKIKKAFELVLAIAIHKKITVHIVEQLQEFLAVYKDMIVKYDQENKDIYISRFKKALKQSIENIHSMSNLERKMNVLGS